MATEAATGRTTGGTTGGTTPSMTPTLELSPCTAPQLTDNTGVMIRVPDSLNCRFPHRVLEAKPGETAAPDRQTQAILTRIRTYGWTLSVFGMSPGTAWRLVKARVQRRIMHAGVAVLYVNVYRRYVQELVKAFRTETGEPLAQAIELVIRKWGNLGLESELLQGLLGDCFLRFEQRGYAAPAVAPPRAERSAGQRLGVSLAVPTKRRSRRAASPVFVPERSKSRRLDSKPALLKRLRLPGNSGRFWLRARFPVPSLSPTLPLPRNSAASPATMLPSPSRWPCRTSLTCTKPSHSTATRWL